MRPSQARYVTACQQLLALGVVLAALTPATAVVTLEVVQQEPAAVADRARKTTVSAPATVPATPVDPEVREVALTAPRAAGDAARRVVPGGAASARGVPDGMEVVSDPQDVTGYGAVGVTWSAGTPLADEQITFDLRTREDGDWSAWGPMEYHDEHQPDPATAEGRAARPGTEPIVVGDVDEVQVRARTATGSPLPADMSLAVIDPGTAPGEREELPAIDTGEGAVDAPTAPADGRPAGTASPDAGEDAIELQAATYTPRPKIFSRAQWGADERLRDKGSLRYFEVHAGFVHHTVNTNDYSRDQVPSIIRSIYAYHTRSRGWSDIGYNFLVDRFGRIWEGRYGGVDRPVVGAHTLGYNDYSFAMSAIGNYDTRSPSSAMVQAYGRLFAWKLSLHGVDATDRSQRVGSRTFPAVNGHRDAGSTACPGRYLYAQLPQIRQLAAAAQKGWSGRELESDLAASPHPDLVVRRSWDKQMLVVPTGGFLQLANVSEGLGGQTGAVASVASPDLTHDGHGDLLVQRSDGVVVLRAGDGAGRFPTSAWRTRLAGHDMLSAVGDVDGDGHHDFVARRTSTGELVVFRGRAEGGFVRSVAGRGWGGHDLIAAAGDLTRDGRGDLVVRDGSTLSLRAADGSGGFAAPKALPGGWGAYDAVTGIGDFNKDGRPDLLVRRKANRLSFIRPGNRNKTFGRQVGPLHGLGRFSSFTAADVTGSGEPDVVGLDGDRVLVRRHLGTYHLGGQINTGQKVGWADTLLNAGDWDRDGDGDVVGRNGAGELMLLRGDGSGRFAAPVRIAGGFGSVRLLAAVGDVTGDGWPDLMGQPGTGAMRLYPGRGLNGLRASYVARGRLDARGQLGIGRWDGDGAPDSLFLQNSRLRVLRGNGPGGLTGPLTDLGVDLSAYDRVLGIRSLRLTGKPDVVLRDRASRRLWFLPGNGTGFGKRRYLGEGWGGYDLVG